MTVISIYNMKSGGRHRQGVSLLLSRKNWMCGDHKSFEPLR